MINTGNNNRVGTVSGIFAALSIITCYGTLALVAALGLIGIQLNVHEGIWAAVIVVLAWAAAIGVGLEFRRIRANGPLVVAILGASFITAVMFISYSRIVEIIGFTLILTAVFWNRRYARQTVRNPPV
jgi:arsenite methyltransferase